MNVEPAENLSGLGALKGSITLITSSASCSDIAETKTFDSSSDKTVWEMKLKKGAILGNPLRGSYKTWLACKPI